MNSLNEKNNLEKKVKDILLFYSSGNYEEVVFRTRPLIKKYPDIMELYNLLALAYYGLNNSSEAIKLLNGVLRREPNNIHTLNNLGMIHSAINNFKESNEFLSKALKLKNDFFQAANNQANLFLKINKANDAIELLKKFDNDENSKNYILNFTLANAYQQSGDFNNSRKYYEKCLNINPKSCEPDKAISLMTNYKNDSTNHLANMKKKLNSKLSKVDLMLLNFSLGKAYEDLDDYKNSLNYLKNANKLNNELTEYNSTKEKKIFENIKLIFKEKININSQNNKDNKKIIFIIGMPRSGTTLIEQILSSNDNIYGGGELPFIDNFALNLFFKNNVEINFSSIKKIEDEKFEELRKNYLNKVLSYNIKEDIITDKTPFNFKWVGLILKTFPNCKIIHCERNGMDICWSNYKNFFSSAKMSYSNSFKNIANYYKLYLDIMNFWKKKYSGSIYNISYEKLIQDPKKEIKNMVNFCDIDWTENYLNFYKNKKIVQTASLAQVRSPLYKSSINKWEKYGKELDELKKLIN